MTEWRKTTLDHLVKLQRGHDLPTGQRRPGNVPVVGAGGPSGLHDTAVAKAPGVVIGRAGASMGHATYCNVDFWPLNTSLYVTDFLGNDPRFVYYLLGQIDFSGFNSGAAQPMLNRNYIKQISIILPTPHEQREISAILGALDDKIAINERIASLYEQLLQCKFVELGLADEPDSDLAVPVTDLVTFNPKHDRPSADAPIYVDMAALPTATASILDWTRRAPKSGSRFMNGDTLMARITPCLENGKTGYVDFMDDGEVGLGSTEFIVLRSRPGTPRELSYYLARDGRFREHVIRNMVGSSGRQRVSAADAANYFVNRPDVDAITVFGAEASAAFAHMKSLASESRNLASLRDALLPQLLSGRLRVRDAEKIVEDMT
ncbi:Type I restriction modification DNA specificity domain protein [Nonomuraea coxensis DSM 45129]|uniref:Type I restriction modification DNA specificity domain protein n=1 Tax=Nonomuraea coxensis DSM 45129 TaxID=1122611 RepID=A0ABX8U9J2_9ACTN|nr:restriction endonuclease subunit S [Nonomuraea coxensis]QYC44447.1 Type I restriction modification DNA specificity domain protein [Nonomuraea coxensis DSM 45129]